MKKILAIFIVAFCFSSCEKDDICADETTPRIILEFFDVSDPTVKKNVTALRVTGFDDNGVQLSTPLETFSGVSVIKLPLKLTQDSTKYSLVLNNTSTINRNEDFLEFDYGRERLYVSRACGYKTNFTLNSPNEVTRTDATPADNFWIRFINIQTTNITTENEVHIKILF